MDQLSVSKEIKNHLKASTGERSEKNKGEMRMKKDFLKKLKRIGTMALAIALVTTLIGSNNMYVTAAEQVLGLEQAGEEDDLLVLPAVDDSQTSGDEGQTPRDEGQTPSGDEGQAPSGDEGQTPGAELGIQTQAVAPRMMAEEAPAANTQMMMSRGISFSNIKLHMTVTDSHGTPLQGATVTFTYYDKGVWPFTSDEYASKSGTTDANGYVLVAIGTNYDVVTNYTVSLANYGTVTKSFSDSIGTGMWHHNERSYSAQLTANVSNTVTFNYSNDFAGTLVSTTQSVLYNEAATAPTDATVQRVGYTFTKWDPVVDLTHVKSALTLNAQYAINLYDVTFLDADDSQLTLKEDVAHGTVLSALGVEDPASVTETIGGVNRTLTFSTWAVVNADNTVTPVTDEYVITGNVTLKAIYTDTVNFYVVDFVLNGGTIDPTFEIPQEVTPGNADISVPNPTKYGHRFLGWLTDGSEVPAINYVISGLEGPKTLSAAYELAQYPVTFNYKVVSTDGKTAQAATDVQTITFGDSLLATAPAAANFETKTHKYTFAGWFYDAALQDKVETGALLTVAEATNLYAKYEVVTIAYFYVLNPGLSMPDEAGQYLSNRYSNPVKVYGALLNNYDGGFLFNPENLADGLSPDVFTEGVGLPTASQFRTNEGKGFNLPANAQITWYVAKTASGVNRYHVDGFINNQEYPLTINYVYEGADAKQAAPSYTTMVGFEDSFTVASPAIEFYTPSLSTVSGVMTGDDSNPLTGLTYTVVYSRTTVPVTVNYYLGSLAGPWLNAIVLNVNLNVLSASDAQEQIAAMAGINSFRPGNTGSGVIRQFEADNRVMGIVYEPIAVVKSFTVTFVDQFGNTLKTEKVTDGNDATAPATLAIAGFTFANWDKAFTDVTSDLVVTALYTAIPTPVPAPTPTPTPTPAPAAEEVVVIEEEETPLAEAPAEEPAEEETPAAEQEVVEIEEEETPLAVLEGDCIIHWIILLITAMYAVYGVLRAVARNKKIRQLQGANDQVNA